MIASDARSQPKGCSFIASRFVRNGGNNCHPHKLVAIWKTSLWTKEVFVDEQRAQFNADKDTLTGIIPGSMGAKSLHRSGSREPAFESFNPWFTAPGKRCFRRGAARRPFSKGRLGRQITGVECRKDVGVMAKFRRLTRGDHKAG